MDANPILAQFVRGNLVENRHRGAYCVADARGRILAAAGAIEAPIFPLSAIKAMQALAMFDTEAAARFALAQESIALACASHHGEPAHVAIAQKTLEAVGLDEKALECGAHPPTNARARNALRATGQHPSALHNNCSGKHAGMLCVARALDVDTRGYVARTHPVQQRVREALEAVLGVALSEGRCGTDGCSIPTWAAPLHAFAGGFARMATGAGLSKAHADASQTIFDAIVAHPHLIAGTDAFDSDAIAVFDGRLVVKIGADGVFCGALRDSGLGFALKCDDGNMAAATTIVAALIKAIAAPNPAQAALLDGYIEKPVRNWRGLEVGVMQADAAAFPQAL